MECFFELPLAVFRREDAEILWRVVAFARANVRAGGKRIDFHVHAAPGAVIRRVRAVIAHQVVAGRIVLHALKHFAEIADVEKRAPAGVSRKRRQRFARILARLALGNDGRAGEHRVAARRARAGVASRSGRQQPARIHGVDRNIRAIRGVGRGDQLRAIFLAGLRDAAGELNDGFLSGNSFEDFAEGLDGGELAVRIENVEFRVVGGERRAGVFGDRRFPHSRPSPHRPARRAPLRARAPARPRIACSNSRSFVKFATTFSVLPKATTATRSAGVICSCRYFCAARVERSRSSACSEVRSKNSTIMR